MKNRRTINPNDCTPLQSLRQAIPPQNRHPICCGDCTGRSTNVAFLPVQRWEMVGLLISALGGYTIEQSKPDTQQGTNPQPRPADGVRARSCVSRAPDAVCVVGRPPGSEYGHGMPCPISRTPFAGTADRPDQSTGTACRAPSAGRRLRGWRTARIRVRARHAVPHDATPVQRDDASATRCHAAIAETMPARNAACGAGSDAASSAPSPAAQRDTRVIRVFAAADGVAVCWIVGQEKHAACVHSNRRRIAPETEMLC